MKHNTEVHMFFHLKIYIRYAWALHKKRPTIRLHEKLIHNKLSPVISAELNIASIDDKVEVHLYRYNLHRVSNLGTSTFLVVSDLGTYICEVIGVKGLRVQYTLSSNI